MLEIDPTLDRTKELVAALEALPPEPKLSYPPAPEGMEWAPAPPSWGITSALNGEWSPATRPDQYTAIQHFQQPEVARALDRLVAIKPGFWRVAEPGFAGMRRAAKNLVVRARYYHAERGDTDAALADLVGVLGLGSFGYGSGELLGILLAGATEGLALSELRLLSRERPLTRKQMHRVVSAMRDLQPGREERWALVIETQIRPIGQALEGCYTLSGDGRGWLVLSRLGDALATPQRQGWRCGAWNGLSVVFNGREVVSAKIETIRAFYEAASGLPYAKALEALEMPAARRDFNLLDGPLNSAQSVRTYAQSTYRVQVGEAAQQNATILTVALSAYWSEVGEYPAALAVLVPEYLESMPLDPFVDEPLRYKLKDDGSYLLYSVFRNQVDDGGLHYWDMGDDRDMEKCDSVYSRPRRESRYEFVVEKGEDG